MVPRFSPNPMPVCASFNHTHLLMPFVFLPPNPSLLSPHLYDLTSSPMLRLRSVIANPLLRNAEGRAAGAGMSAAFSMSSSPSDMDLVEQIKMRNNQNPVVVYSKSWCPYCGAVKGLFNQLGVRPLVVEMDELSEELEVQKALKRLTGQSTVPNVFIGGKHIGGCDDTTALHQTGKLVPLLKAAGAKLS